MEEHFAPDEGESDCQEDGDDGGPGHNSRSSGVAHTDKDGVEKRMEWDLNEDDGQSRETSEELLMGQVGNGVERPAGDDVVSVFLAVEDVLGGGICEEVDQPVNEYQEPDEP